MWYYIIEQRRKSQSWNFTVCTKEKERKTTMKTTSTNFDFVENTTTSNSVESRKLQHTTQLIDLSKTRAVEIMRAIGKAQGDDKTKMVSQIKSGKADDLIELIGSVIKEDDIKSDSTFLNDCTEDEFSKLLESRRSDRSKKLKDGPLSNVSTCTSYIGAMYAECLVRIAWNKPYASGSNEVQVDETDLDSVKRKIKSLQSKKCRLAKTAKFDENDQKELEAVEAEIARLSEFRPTIVAKSVVKSVNVEVLREALQKVQGSLSAEDLDKYKKAGLL
jgi:hypothetical protein